jgi:ATP-dependent exoDNAse (exonuclease V) beta subunit
VGGACAVLRRGHPSADWEGVAREAAAVLKAFFASEAARSLARAEVLGREVPFLYPDGGAVVRGSIDLVYREGGRLRAADYKTDRAGAAAAPAYAAQAASYRKALESATGERCEFSLIFLRSGQIVACP